VLLHTGANLQTESLVGCGETAKAHAGSSVAVGDFNGAGGKEVVVGAPNDDQITPTKIVDAGSVKIYTNGNPAPIYTQYGKAAKDYFGKAVAAGGDVNGDGVKDVLVGVPGLDHPTDKKLKNIGGFVVLYGNKTSAYSRGGDTLGSVAKSGFGSAVALADVNNNGFADLVIGAPKDNYTGSPKDIKGVGSVSVWAGAATEPLALLGSNSTLYGSAKGVQFGASVSAGDTNRDGKADVLMGVPGQDESVEINGKYKMQKDAGRALLMNGSSY
jgi:hypothetical protein